MDEYQEPGSPPPASGRRRLGFYAGIAAGVLAAGLAAAAVIAVIGPAVAQTSSPSPSSSSAPDGLGRRGHFGKFGLGGRGVLHGVFTAPAPDGGYQTLAVQTGTVTAVSNTSITLKSEDGYTHTYAVDDNTLVNAGNEGIDDVSKDDNVRLIAIVDGSTSRAVQVMDITTIRELRGKWMPAPQPKQTASSNDTSSPAA